MSSALLGLGGAIAALNFYLSFVRVPMLRRLRRPAEPERIALLGHVHDHRYVDEPVPPGLHLGDRHEVGSGLAPTDVVEPGA